jgi:hypothetical protein
MPLSLPPLKPLQCTASPRRTHRSRTLARVGACTTSPQSWSLLAVARAFPLHRRSLVGSPHLDFINCVRFILIIRSFMCSVPVRYPPHALSHLVPRFFLWRPGTVQTPKASQASEEPPQSSMWLPATISSRDVAPFSGTTASHNNRTGKGY